MTGRAGSKVLLTAVEFDVFTDPLPQADLITMGMILHDWNLEKKKKLIRADAANARGYRTT